MWLFLSCSVIPLFFSHIWWYHLSIVQYQHHMWLYCCHIRWFLYIISHFIVLSSHYTILTSHITIFLSLFFFFLTFDGHIPMSYRVPRSYLTALLSYVSFIFFPLWWYHLQIGKYSVPSLWLSSSLSLSLSLSLSVFL